MKYLVKRVWVVTKDGLGNPVIPIYQEAFVYEASQSSKLPGLKRLPDDGNTTGFLFRDTKKEAEEALEWVLERYEKAGISVSKGEWQVVRI